ncbi:MAG TPA: hypothetical protein PLP48_08960 [Acholeplasmataceae bacterium]|nr:hypothetical protein [Acholeplasmataceae bacterium]
MISLESLKLYQMHVERIKKTFKYDLSKSVSENIAESVMIDLTLERVNHMLEIKQNLD